MKRAIDDSIFYAARGYDEASDSFVRLYLAGRSQLFHEPCPADVIGHST